MTVHCHLVILKQVPKYSTWEIKKNRMDICIFVCSGWILILVGKWGLGWKRTLLFMVQPFVLFEFLPCTCDTVKKKKKKTKVPSLPLFNKSYCTHSPICCLELRTFLLQTSQTISFLPNRSAILWQGKGRGPCILSSHQEWQECS